MCRRLLLIAAGLVIVYFVATARAWPEDGGKAAPLRAGKPIKLVAQLGHGSSIKSMAFSPDGKQVLTGSSDGTACLWDAASGQEIRRFLGHNDSVECVAFSPDGRQLLTGSDDNTARLWDAASGQEIRRFLGHTGYVESVAFSPDGKQVLTGSYDFTARLWDASSGKEIRRFQGHTHRVESVAFSPDGKQVLTGSGDKTARLWNSATAKVIHGFQGHTDRVRSVAFSPDGKRVLTGSWDKTARLWDSATAKEIHVFQGHTHRVKSVAFSPDGKQVLTGSDDKTARMWDVASGQEIRCFQGHFGYVESVAFSPDGKQVLTSSWDTARLWDAASGQEIRRFEGHIGHVESVAFSPDGKQVITGGTHPRLWDGGSGQEIRRFQKLIGYVESVAFSPDGKQGLLTGSSKTARLWDGGSWKEIRRFQGHTDFVLSVAFSPDGKQVLTGSADKTARLWDAVSGQESRRFQGHAGRVNFVAFSPDGKQVLTGSDDNTARLWDSATTKVIHVFKGHASRVKSVAFSPDGQKVLTGSWDKTARLWDAASGQEIRRFQGHTGYVESVAFSPDGKQVLTGSYDRTARLWDAATGQEIRRFEGHVGYIKSVAFSPDGRKVATGSGDKTVRLWDEGSGKELCSLLSFRDGSWAVVDPAGRFDASNGGKVEGLHWVAGNEPIALNQVKERFYEPGLLAKYMGFNKEPLRNVEALKEVKLFPSVEFKPPEKGDNKLTVQIANQGGGIGKVQVFVNGRELAADARGPKFDPDAQSTTITVDLSNAIVRPGEKNDIRIVTWNKEGYLSSRGVELEWEAPGRKEVQPIELHAIVVGVSDYAADNLKLHFSSKDAVDIAKALELGGKRLFGAAKTHVTLLCDHGPAGTLPPTRTNIENAFEAARKCRPTDVLVVYMAGHGVALPEKDQEVYCYLTKEARTADANAFRDPDVRRQYAVSSTELAEWFKKIPALKQVLILDTCKAGAAANRLIEHRAVGADQIRAIDRLRDRTGFHVLMGCAADKVSWEASKYSQGLLTYALLKGMRGPGLDTKDLVDVDKLFRYAEEEVPQLARDIGGIQKPLVLTTKGNNFYVGQLLAEDRQLVPLANVRPLLLRPILQNADENVLDDDLKLTGRVRNLLSEESFSGSRGMRTLAAVYVDADEMPTAIRPTGKYTVKGKAVSVRVLLRKDGQTIATLQVDGTTDQLNALAERLMAEILAKLKGP